MARQIDELQQSFAELAVKPDVSATDLADAYGSLGQLYYAYAFLEAAEACYRNAIRLAPNDFRWPHLLGYLYHQNGRLGEAVVFYAAALASRPEDFPARVYLGDTYIRLNRRADARDQFQAVLPVYPAAALNGLGEIALSEGRFEDAAQNFEAALQRVPLAGRVRYSLAMAYRGLGRLDEMQSQLQQIGQAGIQVTDPLLDHMQDLPRGERVNLIQGQLALQAGQYPAAVDAFAKAVDASPTSARARVSLGLALAALGETDRAIQQLEVALRLDGEDVAAHFTLGMLLARRERHAAAVDHLRAVIARAGDNVDAYRAISRSLLALGRQEEAIEALLIVTGLDQGDEPSLLTLSTLLMRHGRYQKARDLLVRANRLFPGRRLTAGALAQLDRMK